MLLKNYPNFIKPESSLPFSHNPATRLYPEQNESSPRLKPHSLKVHFNIIMLI